MSPLAPTARRPRAGRAPSADLMLASGVAETVAAAAAETVAAAEADAARATSAVASAPTDLATAATAAEAPAGADEASADDAGALAAVRKARPADLRALGTALAADTALRAAMFGADDPITAADAWLRASRGARLRRRQRKALASALASLGEALATLG